MPVHDRVQQHAQRQPQQTAIDIDGQRLSWQQLWQHSLALYQHIHQQPARSGIVAIATGNDLSFPLSWLAATAQPGIAAIVDPLLPAEQLSTMLARLAPDLLLLKGEDQPLIDLAERLAIRWLAVDHWLAAARLSPPQDDPAPAQQEVAFTAGIQGATPFLINFTSGTTSQPKAFSRSRRSWRSSFVNGEAIFGLAAAPATLFPGPLCHGIGLYCLNETLYAGGTFYSNARWQPAQALALIARQQIERLVLVPTMISGFARVAAAGGAASYPGLKRLLSAGSKLELNHYRQARALFPQARIQEYYGASELGFVAVNTLEEPVSSESLASVGQAFPGTVISIRNEQGEVLAAGQPGTIYLCSEQVIDGYLWGDDGTALARCEEAATVGDLGYLDQQQRLYVTGRRGNMILSGGNNIYLSEVESVIKALPGVTEAVVIAVDDSYLGKKVVAVIEGPQSVLALVPAWCAEKLAKYKIPRQFLVTEQWPLTASGKIKRAELEERIANHDRNPQFTELPASR